MSYFFFFSPWTNIVIDKARQGQGPSPPIIVVSSLVLVMCPTRFSRHRGRTEKNSTSSSQPCLPKSLGLDGKRSGGGLSDATSRCRSTVPSRAGPHSPKRASGHKVRKVLQRESPSKVTEFIQWSVVSARVSRSKESLPPLLGLEVVVVVAVVTLAILI